MCNAAMRSVVTAKQADRLAASMYPALRVPCEASPLPSTTTETVPIHFHPPTQEATAVKLWRNAQRVSSEALAKEDMLRRVSPKKPEGPRLPVLRSSLLRRMDKAVGLHRVGRQK